MPLLNDWLDQLKIPGTGDFDVDAQLVMSALRGNPEMLRFFADGMLHNITIINQDQSVEASG